MRRDSDDSTSTEGGGSTGDSTRELKVCELFLEKRQIDSTRELKVCELFLEKRQIDGHYWRSR